MYYAMVFLEVICWAIILTRCILKIKSTVSSNPIIILCRPLPRNMTYQRSRYRLLCFLVEMTILLHIKMLSHLLVASVVSFSLGKSRSGTIWTSYGDWTHRRRFMEMFCIYWISLREKIGCTVKNITRLTISTDKTRWMSYTSVLFRFLSK